MILVVAPSGVVHSAVPTVLPGLRPAVAAKALTSVTTLNTGPFDAWRSTIGEQYSSPAFGDVTGDGVIDLVAGMNDGFVYVWRTDNWALRGKYYTGNGAVQGSITLADLNGDGILDILATNLAGDIIAFGGNGNVIFHAHSGGPGTTPGSATGIFGTPVVADIDKSGHPEIVVSGWDQYLHVFRMDGSEIPGFPVAYGDTSWSSPAVADIDGSGWPSIVVGFDCDGVPGQRCYGQGRGGYVGVYRHDGTMAPGWPRFYNGQVIWSSPALANLEGKGQLDVVVGTGNMPLPGGQQVLAFRPDGSNLPGWPVNVGGKVMSSPAIGALYPDGVPDVVTVSDDGHVNVNKADGTLLWSRCVVDDNVNCPNTHNVHASASIADIFNDGRQLIVVGGDQILNVFDGQGNLLLRAPGQPGTFPFVAAPTIASVNGRTLIAQVSGFDNPKRGTVYIWSTGTDLGPSAWPTFRQNLHRLGTVGDTTPPTIALSGLPSQSSATNDSAGFTATDTGSGPGSVHLDVAEDGGPWATLANVGGTSGPTLSGSVPLWVMRGHTYHVRANATDLAGNTSGWVTATTIVPPNATRVQPFTAAYAVGAEGLVSGLDSPPRAGPVWSSAIGRGIAVDASGSGGWVLDGWGGMHEFGNATPLAITGWWPGQDIARGVAMSSDGTWGYVLDMSGGLHAVGSAITVYSSSWWPGQDIARGVVLLPGATKQNPGGYVLDMIGGVHPFGSAPPILVTGYWPGGGDVARGIALDADGLGGYVVERQGGLHPLGNAQNVYTTGWWPGQDVARAVATIGTAPNPSGWVLDYFGGAHPFGQAPGLYATGYGPQVNARGIAVRP